MDEQCKNILNLSGIEFNELSEINNYIVSRDILICDKTYEKVKPYIQELKNIFSSSTMTCLHKNTIIKQKWPLLNLVRQILSAYNYILIPIRKSNGYTKCGKKLYKRYFCIQHIHP